MCALGRKFSQSHLCLPSSLFDRYPTAMGSTPPDRSVDVSALGPTLVIGACVILAIRTARRDSLLDAHSAQVEWQREIEFAIALANRVVMQATVRHPSSFRQKVTEFTTGVVEEDLRA